MSARVFLDTNVFIYALDGTDSVKEELASRLIAESADTRKGVISYQVVQEFFNIALRRFRKPMNALDAEQLLGTMFRPLLAIQSSDRLFAEALRLCARHRLSWYDSLIVAAALQAQCEILYTEDLQHGQRFGDLRITNPFLANIA